MKEAVVQAHYRKNYKITKKSEHSQPVFDHLLFRDNLLSGFEGAVPKKISAFQVSESPPGHSAGQGRGRGRRR